MPGEVRQHLHRAEGEHDLVEAGEIGAAHGRAEAQLGLTEAGGVEVEQRAPAAPAGSGRGRGECAADARRRVEHHHVAAAGERQRALEPGGPGADDRHAPVGRVAGAAHDERRGGPARLAGRPEGGVDRAQQDRVERSAVLVAGDARTDLRRAAARGACAACPGRRSARAPCRRGRHRRPGRLRSPRACGTPARRAAARRPSSRRRATSPSSGGASVAMSRTYVVRWPTVTLT